MCPVRPVLPHFVVIPRIYNRGGYVYKRLILTVYCPYSVCLLILYSYAQPCLARFILSFPRPSNYEIRIVCKRLNLIVFFPICCIFRLQSICLFFFYSFGLSRFPTFILSFLRPSNYRIRKVYM